MKHAWIDTQRSAFPLPVLCDALSVSQSGFRAWQAGGTPERKRLTDGQALVLIRTIHQEVGTSAAQPGSPFAPCPTSPPPSCTPTRR